MSTAPASTIVHLLRHGEVHNPEGILYGRREGYHLSPLGVSMAQRVADTIGERDIVHLRSSPLERARETAGPLATALGIEPVLDARVIESANVFEGERFGAGLSSLKRPRAWKHLWNPLRPSWGEPYKQIAARMTAAVQETRVAAAGHEAVIVSHQLPIWVARLAAERHRFPHDPRKRQCTLCSLTSLHFEGERLVRISYSEPAVDLIPLHARGATFSAGGAPAEEQP